MLYIYIKELSVQIFEKDINENGRLLQTSYTEIDTAYKDRVSKNI